MEHQIPGLFCDWDYMETVSRLTEGRKGFMHDAS